MVIGNLLQQAQSTVSSWMGGASSSSQTLSKDIKIKNLYVHPIKSCRGTSVTSVTCTNDGLLYDRQWLIIDANTKKFCTARDLSQMVLIEPQMDEEGNALRIRVPLGAKGTVTIETPLEPDANDLARMDLVKEIIIWGQTVDGYAVSADADAVLSEFFGKAVRLVRKGPSPRPAGPDDRRKEKPTLNFQDFYPLLVASEKSIEHVQQTLLKNVYPSMSSSASDTAEQQQQQMDIPDVRVPNSISLEYWTPEQLESLPIVRFRPNIVLESQVAQDGTPALLPWEEDGFLELEIFDASGDSSDDGGGPPSGSKARGRGKMGISCVARCARCTVPCIDPETGIRDPHLPYKMLQGFRQVDPAYKKLAKPSFGVLGTFREGGDAVGTLRVGDIVRVTSVMDPAQRVSTK